MNRIAVTGRLGAAIAVTLIVGAPATGAQVQRVPPAPVPAPVQGPVLSRGAVVSRLAAPPAPAGVTVTGTPATATVVWKTVAGVASYVVTRKQSNLAVQQAKLAAADTIWNDIGLRPFTAYSYMVNAIHPDGREAYTEVAFTTPPAINPTGFTAIQTGNGQVQLTWQRVAGASYYVVNGAGSSNGGVKVGLTKATVTPSYAVTGVPLGLQTWTVGSYYDPGPVSVTAPLGPNAVSTPAAQFPRVQLNVAATTVNTGAGGVAATSSTGMGGASASSGSGGKAATAMGASPGMGGSPSARGTGASAGASTNQPPGASAGASADASQGAGADASTGKGGQPASAPSASGQYRVVANGFRVIHETHDDVLSRDGMYDEVYAAFAMFQYNRKTSLQAGFDLKQTLKHGDVKGRPDRVQAGTASGTGGLRAGDVFPAVADPSQRYGAALKSNSFPLQVWQGTLTDGLDAVLILPTMWESDENSASFVSWFPNEMISAPRIWADLAVQQAITTKSLGLVTLSGSMVTTGGPTSSGAAFAMFLTAGASLMFTGSWDRPIGLQESGPAPVLPRRVIVLTREIIENAFASSGGVASVKIEVPLVDAPRPDLQGNYALYIQVERIP